MRYKVLSVKVFGSAIPVTSLQHRLSSMSELFILRAMFRESVTCLLPQRPRSLTRFRFRICDLCWAQLPQRYVFSEENSMFPSCRNNCSRAMNCFVQDSVVYPHRTVLHKTHQITTQELHVSGQKISILDPHMGTVRVAIQ